MAMEIYKKGSSGLIVKQIQKALNLIPDGKFGPIMEEAVKNFQKRVGVKVDGVVGPATLSKLFPSYLRRSKRDITEIIVHCTATKEGAVFTVNDIRKWHLKRGLSDIGYHYVIYLDGSRVEGRDIDKIGAHVKGHNSNSIGIVYVGGLDKFGNPKDTRTKEQKAALQSLLLDLRKLYPKAKILGHRDCSPDLNKDGIIDTREWIKDCPCFDAKTEYSRI